MRQWQWTVWTGISIVSTLVHGQSSEPTCNRTLQTTPGQHPALVSGGCTDDQPCGLAVYCEQSHVCGFVPPGEGLISCGTYSTVTYTCSVYTNGICKDNYCYRSENSEQVYPDPPIQAVVGRYTGPQECGE